MLKKNILITALAITILFPWTSAYIIELEVNGRKKQCISEIFKKNEPISMRAYVTAANTNDFSLYLTIGMSNYNFYSDNF